MKTFKIEFHEHPLILSESATTYTKTIKDVVFDIEKMGIDITLVKSISEVDEQESDKDSRKINLLQSV